jgi:hypothetical protein
MKEFGIPAKLITLTKMTLSRTCNTIEVQNKLSGSFRTECVIRQGDSLSTLLFNICLEKMMRNIKINPGGTVFNRTRQFMAYTDDVAVNGTSVGVLNEVLMQLQTVAISTRLVVNTTKTKYMRSKETTGAANIDIKLHGQIYERVDNFKYLGALVTSQNETEADIKDKTAAGNHCFQAFNTTLGTSYLSKNMKIRTYKTIISPIILYSSETWTITGKTASTLDDFGKKDFKEN